MRDSPVDVCLSSFQLLWDEAFDSVDLISSENRTICAKGVNTLNQTSAPRTATKPPSVKATTGAHPSEEGSLPLVQSN
jgi:hypothetical protein